MKCCMVACINMLYWGNRSAAASAVGGGGGGRVGGFVFFTRFRPFGVDLQNFFSTENFYSWNLEKFAMYDVITVVPVVKIFSENFFFANRLQMV